MKSVSGGLSRRLIAFRGPLILIVAVTLTVVTMVFVGKFTYDALHAGYALSDVRWSYIAISGAFGLGGYLLAPLLWIQLLKIVGWQGGSEGALYRTYTRSWLARYIPGNFWNLGGRALLASRIGVPSRPLTFSILLEAFFLRAIPLVLGGALAIAFLVHLVWGVVVVVIGLVLVTAGLWVVTSSTGQRAFKASPLVGPLFNGALKDIQPLRFNEAVRWSLMYSFFTIPSFFFFTFLTVGVLDVSVNEALKATSGWVLASTLGSFVVFSPAAFGARDGIALLVIGTTLGAPEAGLVVAASRLLTIVADLSFVAFGEIVGPIQKAFARHAYASRTRRET